MKDEPNLWAEFWVGVALVILVWVFQDQIAEVSRQVSSVISEVRDGSR